MTTTTTTTLHIDLYSAQYRSGSIIGVTQDDGDNVIELLWISNGNSCGSSGHSSITRKTISRNST